MLDAIKRQEEIQRDMMNMMMAIWEFSAKNNLPQPTLLLPQPWRSFVRMYVSRNAGSDLYPSALMHGVTVKFGALEEKVTVFRED